MTGRPLPTHQNNFSLRKPNIRNIRGHNLRKTINNQGKLCDNTT